ncbi:hypothetical protein [Deinococcus sp.]|uniref:helix-hairpin-helix domain-containing protein n=1 Tax=Deinococcus sp. TaxID=47478 RepID=UPI003B58ECD4
MDYSDLPDDPAVWQRLASGDTLAIFQIESPAQVQMTARLQPQNLTQLAHQIALIRPGPIQSGTVHPYVRRARGEEAAPALPESLHTILSPTHGTLLFQEQILRLAVHYAGYSWAEADQFRSRLSKTEDAAELAALKASFVAGAGRAVGAAPDEAGAVFDTCAAFRGFGFAESHAWAFAQHAYASAWMRQQHPAAYLASVLTEAPGLWPASTISQEARRWGVSLRGVCLNRSGLSYRAETERAVRLPLTVVAGVSQELARSVVQERLTGGKYLGLADLYDRVSLQGDMLEKLIKAGALESLHSRREAAYALGVLMNARAAGTRGLLSPQQDSPSFAELTPDETLRLDLATKGLSETGRHPLDAHRARLRDLGCVELSALRHGQDAWTAGFIVTRQRPPTARGFAFFVLEDRSARVQAIISPDLWEAHRALLHDARALIVQGEASVQGRAVTLKVRRLSDLPLGTWASAAD